MAEDLAAVAVRNGWTVREPRDDDAADLLALIGGVFAEYPGCVLDRDGVDADLQAWASHLDAAGGRAWLVHDETGRLVGCIGVAPCESPPSLAASTAAVELKRCYVHAAARRRGLGHALVGRVEAWAREHGAAAVTLWSDTRFTDAHRLYGRRGYVDTGRRRDLHDPSDTTEAEFVRRLA